MIKLDKLVGVNVTVINDINAGRGKVVTMEDARKAVVKQLNDNLAYINSGFDKDKKCKGIVFKEGNGVYRLGVKYGRRWITNVFETGAYLDGLTLADVTANIEMLASAANDGELDKEIKEAMDANKRTS